MLGELHEGPERGDAPRVEVVGPLIVASGDRVGQDPPGADPIARPHFLPPATVSTSVGDGRQPADVGKAVVGHVVVRVPAVLRFARRRSALRAYRSSARRPRRDRHARACATRPRRAAGRAPPQGIARSVRLGESTCRYIPCGSGPFTSRLIAYERSTLARAKNSPRSRKGSWVATIDVAPRSRSARAAVCTRPPPTPSARVLSWIARTAATRSASARPRRYLTGWNWAWPRSEPRRQPRTGGRSSVGAARPAAPPPPAASTSAARSPGALGVLGVGEVRPLPEVAVDPELVRDLAHALDAPLVQLRVARAQSPGRGSSGSSRRSGREAPRASPSCCR